MATLKKLPIHPVLFALYPVLYLLAANVDQVNPVVALRPGLLSLLAALLLLGLLQIVLKDTTRAALVTTVLIIAFFTYGHLLRLLKPVNLAGIILGRHRYLALPFFALALLLAWQLYRASPSTRRTISSGLNLVGALLVGLSLLQIGNYTIRSAVAVRTGPAGALAQTSGLPLPDVYFIVMDGYARADVLKKDFGYDNSAFIRQLEKLGFYVAAGSTSNYNVTDFSLASTLNLDYLSALGKDFSSGGEDRYRLPALIKESRVRQTLETLGYRTVAFETGYSFTDWWGASTFLSPETGGPLAAQGLRPFENMLLKTTAASIIMDAQLNASASSPASASVPYADHIAQVRFTLNRLPYVPLTPSPKLVFAHIVLPHKPLVFQADGSLQTDSGYYSNESDPIDRDYFQRGYLDQVRFANSLLPGILRDIQQNSKTPPVIVLLGDHGYYWGSTRFENLLAVYAPGGNQDFYPTISNVNVFRLILDRYFGGLYPLLPDQRYQEDGKAPAGFKLLTDASPSLGKSNP